MEKKLDLILEKLTMLDELKLEIERINGKLDVISVQVAHNTEQETILNDIATQVKNHDADIKLIKRVLSNQ